MVMPSGPNTSIAVARSGSQLIVNLGRHPQGKNFARGIFVQGNHPFLRFPLEQTQQKWLPVPFDMPPQVLKHSTRNPLPKRGQQSRVNELGEATYGADVFAEPWRKRGKTKFVRQFSLDKSLLDILVKSVDPTFPGDYLDA